MRVGIIEICEPNHYSAVQALAKTYAINPENQVFVFVTDVFVPVFGKDTAGMTLVPFHANTDPQVFLNTILSEYQLDRIHINTISKSIGAYSATHWHGRVFFTIHNVEQWFDNGFLNRTRLLLFKVRKLFYSKYFRKLYQEAVLYLKDFRRQYQRDIFIKKLTQADYRIIVYSESQQEYLSKFIPPSRIINFPFALREDLPDNSLNSPLRICVPGSVTIQRRDYLGLLHMIEVNLAAWKERVIWDFLGFVSEDSLSLIPHFEKISRAGVKILYYTHFISGPAFDIHLSKADILLGNVHLQLNPTQRYGQTKESGVIFNMIKSGKPCLLPKGYDVDEDLKSAFLFYEDYSQLSEYITEFIVNSQKLSFLKQDVVKVTTKFTPKHLYKRLM
ncbi:hypothetical protein [Runella sp.]|uniref:hypothetical protein n=1 Tax=Runella sp. TaxID=1960881 RepID=UPI0026256DE9|nr:hypothetical protein [Runella sp.]